VRLGGVIAVALVGKFISWFREQYEGFRFVYRTGRWYDAYEKQTTKATQLLDQAVGRPSKVVDAAVGGVQGAWANTTRTLTSSVSLLPTMLTNASSAVADTVGSAASSVGSAVGGAASSVGGKVGVAASSVGSAVGSTATSAAASVDRTLRISDGLGALSRALADLQDEWFEQPQLDRELQEWFRQQEAQVQNQVLQLDLPALQDLQALLTQQQQQLELGIRAGSLNISDVKLQIDLPALKHLPALQDLLTQQLQQQQPQQMPQQPLQEYMQESAAENKTEVMELLEALKLK